jgi:uncharacterized protein with NAD-binding domain and iron-sulfur cluster
MRMTRVGIIGGGIAGLVAAYELAKAGLAVTVIESSGKLGGLAASFAIEDGHEIEKYYHFICKPDRTYFQMLQELDTDERGDGVSRSGGGLGYRRGEADTLARSRDAICPANTSGGRHGSARTQRR